MNGYRCTLELVHRDVQMTQIMRPFSNTIAKNFSAKKIFRKNNIKVNALKYFKNSHSEWPKRAMVLTILHSDFACWPDYCPWAIPWTPLQRSPLKNDNDNSTPLVHWLRLYRTAPRQNGSPEIFDLKKSPIINTRKTQEVNSNKLFLHPCKTQTLISLNGIKIKQNEFNRVEAVFKRQ